MIAQQSKRCPKELHFTVTVCYNIQQGPFLRIFVLWQFTSTTLVDADRMVHHCRNSSVLSVLSALPALFRCACVSSFFYFSAVLLSWLPFFHSWRPLKRQKEEKIKPVDVTFFLDVVWNMAWSFFSKIKSDLIDILSIICVIFYKPNSLK